MDIDMRNPSPARMDIAIQGANHAQKKMLRARCREIAERFTEEYIEEAGRAMAERVRSLKAYGEAETVFCYMSMPKEASTEALLEALFADGKRVAIPLCTGPHDMVAKLYHPGDELAEGAYGIREPLASAETLDPSTIDLAIVPCVACDRQGKRLGHGAGYYDRFLENIEAVTVALCPEPLIVGNVPWYRHDIVMDYVATDENIYGRRWHEEEKGEKVILPLR